VFAFFSADAFEFFKALEHLRIFKQVAGQTFYLNGNLEYAKFGIGLTTNVNEERGWVNLFDNKLYLNLTINKNGTVSPVDY
jgi:hypothetical protein